LWQFAAAAAAAMLEQPSGRPLRQEEQELSPGFEQPPCKPREAYWDNVKAVCVLLVICCHALLTGSGVAPGQNNLANMLGGNQAWLDQLGSSDLASLTGSTFALSMVVMPGFTFVSGHLSSKELSARRVRNLLQMALSACIQQALSVGLLAAFGAQQGLPLHFYGALGVQWFLICLVFWRVSLPFWTMLRRPLLVSVIVGCGAMLTDVANTNVHSFMCFLPFFIAGHLTSREQLERWRRPSVRVAFFAVVVLAASIPLLVIVANVGGDPADINKQGTKLLGQTYGCFMSEDEVCSRWSSVVLRLLYYLGAVPMIPAFLATIPERPVWGLTRAGQFSMYIYLLHIWLLAPFHAAAQYLHGGLYVLGALLYSLCTWALLGTGCARPCCKWCIEPSIGCLVQPQVFESHKSEGEAARSRPPTQQEILAARQESCVAAEV